MKTLRVSATDIDALRRFRADEEAELSVLLSQLRREEHPSEAMLAGTALHAALENAVNGDHSEFEADGYRFTMDFNDEIWLPEIREMKATRDYTVGDVCVTLVGKVDGIIGRKVIDHKFTGRYDPERFLNSYQWRIYLEIFGADAFTWNVFEGRETAPKEYVISRFHTLSTHRYPGMDVDVLREVSEFVAFATEHLPEKIIDLNQITLLAG